MQDCHATLFDMTQPQCNDQIHLLSDILLKTLRTSGELPERNHLRVKICQADAKMYCLTERKDRWNVHGIQRGKNHVIAVKKTHNVKNDLLCTPDKRILWLSKTYDGHVHDKKIVDEQPLSFPTGITLWQDTGFFRSYA